MAEEPILTATTRRTHTTIAHDGTNLVWHEYLREGAPVPQRTLLLTNGIGTTERFWRHLVDAFAEHDRVVHWSYRGHGASGSARSGDYRIRTHADDLARVTAAVTAGGSPPVQVGFSMGVTVVLELYRARPDLASSLILIGGPADAPYANTLPLRLPGVARMLRGSMRALTPAVPFLAPTFNAFARSSAAYPFARTLRLIRNTAPRDDIRAFTEALTAMDPIAFWASATSLMEAHASDVLPTVRVPALVIGATHDVFVPESQIDELIRKLPHVSFVRIAGAGHALLIEAGPAVVRAIRGFLETTS